MADLVACINGHREENGGGRSSIGGGSGGSLDEETCKPCYTSRDGRTLALAAEGNADHGLVVSIKAISRGGGYRYVRINPGAFDEVSAGLVVWSWHENMPAVGV